MPSNRQFQPRIGYRILEKQGNWVRPNEDHTPRQGIMRDIYEIASNLLSVVWIVRCLWPLAACSDSKILEV